MDDAKLLSVLGEYGVPFRLHPPWAHVGETHGTGGWKLHLSSIPIQAPRLLRTVLPIFQSAGIAFKFTACESDLFALNEGVLGPTQIGKFITVYPRSTESAVSLASELVKLTSEFEGPVVRSDMWLGGVVYARFGSFNPIIRSNRLGQRRMFIHLPDGTLYMDRYAVPHVPPPGVTVPFAEANLAPEPRSSHRPLGPGYLPLDVVKSSAKGSVFLGLDVRNREQCCIKVMKHGRRHCMTDRSGRDIRSRLKHQQTLHEELRTLGFPAPSTDDYFEVEGDGYLPLELLEGETLEHFVLAIGRGRSWGDLPADERQKLLLCLSNLIVAVESLHVLGYVHRDLTVSNVLVNNAVDVQVIDYELCCRTSDEAALPFGGGTPGFMSPQQERGSRPTVADDIFALGCLALFILTGMDPRVMLALDEDFRHRQLVLLTGVEERLLFEPILRAVSRSERARPELRTIAQAVHEAAERQSELDADAHSRRTSRVGDDPNEVDLRNCVRMGQLGLLKAAPMDVATGLWLSPTPDDELNHLGRVTGSGYELRTDAHRGVAGVVYTLARLARCGFEHHDQTELVKKAIEWLVARVSSADDRLPGLYFGDAGIAVAITEAIVAGIQGDDDVIRANIECCLSGRLDWPDVTHGAAGQGIAALYCAAALADDELLQIAHRCAEYLIQSQETDGSWRMPGGADGLSGQVVTGFAHGVAGVAYFLSHYAERTGSRAAETACRLSAAWLADQSIESADGCALEWHYSDENRSRWKWWCHGSPGIALLFLQLFRQTGERSYRAIASRALQVHQARISFGNRSQCHGSSGLGEIYLEAARVLEDTHWLERAEAIAKNLRGLAATNGNGAVLWPVEKVDRPSADLMVGSGGVLHFLLRLATKERALGFPLLL